jgi:hypothetical protein
VALYNIRVIKGDLPGNGSGTSGEWRKGSWTEDVEQSSWEKTLGSRAEKTVGSLGEKTLGSLGEKTLGSLGEKTLGSLGEKTLGTRVVKKM